MGAAASMAMGGAQGVMGAAGSILGGYSTAAADRYQANVAMRNASQAANNADTIQFEGDAQSQIAYQQGSQKMGAARAAYGASGVDVNSGSAVAAQQSIARTTALNAQGIKFNADTQAVGYRDQVANYDTQASADRAAGSNAITGGFIGAAGSLLGSASSVASKWDSFKNAGLTGTTSAGTTGIDGTVLAAAGGTNPWAASMLPVGG